MVELCPPCNSVQSLGARGKCHSVCGLSLANPATNIAVRMPTLARIPRIDRRLTKATSLNRIPGDRHALNKNDSGRTCPGRKRAAARRRSGCTTLPKPERLGVARTVEIDTTGGPGFGMEQYKMHDFLLAEGGGAYLRRWTVAGHTRAVLAALANHCTKATFFPIGKHALWHPEILKEVAAAGHTIGSHTWSHANLAKMKGDKATEEIEKGLSAVALALGTPPPPSSASRSSRIRRTSSPTSARATLPSSPTTSIASISRCASPRRS